MYTKGWVAGIMEMYNVANDKLDYVAGTPCCQVVLHGNRILLQRAEKWFQCSWWWSGTRTALCIGTRIFGLLMRTPLQIIWAMDDPMCSCTKCLLCFAQSFNTCVCGICDQSNLQNVRGFWSTHNASLAVSVSVNNCAVESRKVQNCLDIWHKLCLRTSFSDLC